jgi:hypothetical protein
VRSKTDDADIRVLKAGSCPSLSGKSKLGYEIGCNPAAEIYLRIAKNSGKGYYSGAWVAWDKLHQVLGKPGGKPITFNTLGPIFQGKSINTAGFLLAVLKHEGLVQPSEAYRRCYERLDPATFLGEIQALTGVKPAAAKAAKTAKAVAKKIAPRVKQ